MMIYNGGRAVQVSYGGNLSRKEEREALSKLAEVYRQQNENYRLTGRPNGLMAANERKGLLGDLPKGELRPLEAPPFSVEISPEARQILKRSGAEAYAADETEYFPVTEIRSEHFRWTEADGIEETITEADGIEETITEAEELAARKESFRQVFTTAISQSIGEILKPRATYEEAFDALYMREGVAWKSSFDDSHYGFTQILTPVNGAFGVLATHLNDYLDQFGAEDGYFDTLLGALDELDMGDDNALLQQMRDMVKTVRDGNTINTQSDGFKNDVKDAIVDTYVGGKKKVSRQKEEQDGKKEETARGGLSYLDMERRKANEEKHLLDKLTGQDSDERPASAGEVLAQYRRNEEDEELRDKLRKADEERPGEGEMKAASTQAKPTGTPIEKTVADCLTMYCSTWNRISERNGWGATTEA